MTTKIADGPRPQPATLVEELGELADFGAELETELGLRPERVFFVRYSWSGGEIGSGKPSLVWTKEILPRPIVNTTVGYHNAHGGGFNGRGTARLEGLSPRFVEADLEPSLSDLPEGDEIMIEVVRDRRDGRGTVRAPFRVSGRPERRPDNLDYVLSLQAIDDNRTTDEHRRDWTNE